jgi:hypothetical protein
LELAGDGLGMGIEEQLGIVEPQAPFGTIVATDLVPVELPWPETLHVGMPDELVAILEPDDVGGLAIGFVEQQQKRVGACRE